MMTPKDQFSRIHGCWIGKSIGGTLGLPAEGRTDRLSFTFYDPIPTTAPPNDDLELQLVWLDLVEKTPCSSLTMVDFAAAWTDSIHYMWDEYGRCRWNLRRGVPIESCGSFENPFDAGMGSPIRSEIWACLFPGDPESAAYYAALDASLDHGTEGIAGEVFFAVMQNLAASGTSIGAAIDRALRFIPMDSETARAVRWVKDCQEPNPWRCRELLLRRHGSPNFTHAPLNVALTIWALLYGSGEFEKSILLAVNGGYDTDCTAATVGATLGLVLGAEGIPVKWSRPIGDDVHIGRGIRNISAPTTLRELSERTVAAIGKLDAKKWNVATIQTARPQIDLGSLPGTISVTPLNTNTWIEWANGEMPPEVKRAGGARWEWKVAEQEVRYIVCLATAGASLYIDGRKVLECPPNLPYVPATHRCPDQAKTRVLADIGIHEVELRLDTDDAAQKVSVILAYSDFHLAPWTAEELPDKANLIGPELLQTAD